MLWQHKKKKVKKGFIFGFILYFGVSIVSSRKTSVAPLLMKARRNVVGERKLRASHRDRCDSYTLARLYDQSFLETRKRTIIPATSDAPLLFPYSHIDI